MNKKNKIAIIAFLLIISMLAANVSGIGITPGRRTIEFEPGAEHVVRFNIINNEHKDMRVILRVDGDTELEDFVELSTDFVEFKASEESKEFSYRVSLPNTLSRPGDHEVSIIARELEPDVDADGTYIGVSVAVASQLIVRSPIPGKHVNFRFDVSETDDEVKFILPVMNLGTARIAQAQAIIDVQTPDNEPVVKLISTKEAIDAGETKELIASWNKTDVRPGYYYGIAVLSYDGGTATEEKFFTVGSPNVVIRDVSVSDFQLGQVAKFDISVESEWSEIIEDLYADMTIEDSSGNTVGQSKSAEALIGSYGTTTLEAFWDTAGQSTGFYNATINLHYKGKVSENRISLEVTLDQIRAFVLSAEAVSGRGGNLTRNAIITLALITLIILNIIWYRYLRKKKEGNEQS